MRFLGGGGLFTSEFVGGGGGQLYLWATVIPCIYMGLGEVWAYQWVE